MYYKATMKLDNVVDTIALDLAMNGLVIKVKNLQCSYSKHKLVLAYVPRHITNCVFTNDCQILH